jgi:hypothetical protein
MKTINLIIITGAVVVTTVLLFLSCKKETGKEVAIETTNFNNSAIIQVYNASVPSAATDPRRNYVYVDGSPITGARIDFGTFFPSSSTGAAITGGLKQLLIKDTLSASVQPPMSFAETFQAGKSYTIFMYDTFTAIKQKTVETIIQIPSDTTARVRFANFVYYPTAIPGIDIFSTRRNAFVVSNLLPTQVTDFIPYASSLSDTLFVTESGNPSNKLDTLAGFNPTRKRSYTLVFRGRWRTNETIISGTTTAPNPRTLASFPNN